MFHIDMFNFYLNLFVSSVGCTAKARIEGEVFIGVDGDLYDRNTMTQVSTPES